MKEEKILSQAKSFVNKTRFLKPLFDKSFQEKAAETVLSGNLKENPVNSALTLIKGYVDCLNSENDKDKAK